MLRLRLVVGLMLVTLGVSCAKKNDPAVETHSIRSDYKEKFDFILASLTSTQELQLKGKLPEDNFKFLDGKLAEIRDIIPAHGFTVGKSFKNPMSIEFPWDIDPSQPAIRLDSLEVTAICLSACAVPKLEVVSDGFAVDVDPLPNSTVWMDPGATGYDPMKFPALYPPQYSVQPGLIVRAPKGVHLAGDLPNCWLIQHVVYAQFSADTLHAMAAWKGAITQIQGDLADLSRDDNPPNYPINYALAHIVDKLKVAFAALP